MEEFQFGDGKFAFSSWPTPFENAKIELRRVTYRPRSLSALDDDDLIISVGVRDANLVYRLTFRVVTAFRVLDEGGLVQLWAKTEEMGGRPGRTTFRVRNHHWSKESIVSFLPTDGWSYLIASDDECVEIVTRIPPTIILEEIADRTPTASGVRPRS
jgi:hypothetical protein